MQTAEAYFQSKQKPTAATVPLLDKLPQDKRIIPITLDVKLSEDFTLRDRFDWNLDTVSVTPTEFAEQLCEKLGLGQSAAQIADSILAQITESIPGETTSRGHSMLLKYHRKRGRKPLQVRQYEQFEKSGKTLDFCEFCDSKVTKSAGGCNQCMLDY